MKKIYGDGINLDTEGIQELLDSGSPLVELPVPKKEYLIDKPLRLHSNQELKLPRYCRIKLAAGSNCHMVINDDFDNGTQNITLTGGIWDYNNLEQDKNPQYVKIIEKAVPPRKGTDVTVMRFKNTKGLHINNLTVKDPVTYAIWIDMSSYFTVENIVFDFNLGNPRPANMDGVHVDGNSHYGTIRNIKGKCYDDLVALNADEGSDGDISHIDVDGLYAEDCHSAVRLLTRKNKVTNIHIHNVFGSYYQYVIGLTKYCSHEIDGFFDAIVLDNLHVRKAVRYLYLSYSEQCARDYRVLPIVYLEDLINVKSLSIKELYRVEENVSIPTISVGDGASVENLSIKNCYSENRTDTPFAFYEQKGTVKKLVWENNRMVNGKLYLPETLNIEE
ncbi:MAG: hypothetical protein E7565_09145 [Ruminococcaceae bacterium]|nr:hypothetical protein [Oscillospiraceae bacterium]